MKIVFPIRNERKGGTENWRRYLTSELKKRNRIVEIELSRLPFYIKDIIKADLIHAYRQDSNSLVIMLIGKLFGKKIIYTAHGNFYEESNNKRGLKRIFWLPFNKLCSFLSDKIVFPSRYLYREVTKRDPNLKTKSEVIPNGLSIELSNQNSRKFRKTLGLRKDDFLVLEITNFNLKQKAQGIDLLVKDFQEFNKKFPKSFLYILGKGRMLEQYKEKYEGERIKFLGFKENVKDYIKSCDLLVHYSFLDTFGMVILEGLFYKKPVIAYGSPAFKEILGESIRLSKMNKKLYYDLVSKIKKIKLINYSAKKVCQDYEKLYEDL